MIMVKQMVGSRKNLSKPKIEKESKDDKIKNIRNLFKLKKENKVHVMAYDNPDKIIEKLFNWLLFRCQIGLETQITGSDFMFSICSSGSMNL